MPRRSKKTLSCLFDVPLSAGAQALLNDLQIRISDALEEVNQVAVPILIWGPDVNSSHPLARVRLALRAKLRQQGHAAMFSEDLCDPNSSHSIRVQQLAQAQKFDLIVSIPATAGSIAEVHDFAADRRVNGKLLVFVNREHMDGYGPKSLQTLETVISCQIVSYPNERETAIIEEVTLQTAQRIREMRYIAVGQRRL